MDSICFLESNGLFFKHEISLDLPRDTYSMHTHNMYELLYFINGDATHIIEDRKYKLKKGDLILIRPSQYHFIQIDSPSDYERYDILFDEKLLNIESVSLISSNIEIIDTNPIVQDIFQKTDYYYNQFDSQVFVKIMSLLLNELFYLLSISPQRQQNNSYSVISPVLSEALHYINVHLCTLSDIEDIAKKCFVSKSYLFRLFKKELHQTPKKYINNKRLLMAQRQIAAGKTPIDVYEDCGFADYSTFYRNYIALFGYSPSQEKQHP